MEVLRTAEHQHIGRRICPSILFPQTCPDPEEEARFRNPQQTQSETVIIRDIILLNKIAFKCMMHV